MDNKLHIGILQLNPTVENLQGNLEKITNFYNQNLNLDVIVCGEMALSGYLPKDSLFNPSYLKKSYEAIESLKKLTKANNTALIVGEASKTGNNLYSSAFFIKDGEIKNIIRKKKLVNYDVFNEYRYFTEAAPEENNIIYLNGFKIGLCVCEDLWYQDFVDSVAKENPDLLISINASPYEENKLENRIKVVKNAALKINNPVVYTNLVGGTDAVVYDGQSLVCNKEGTLTHKLELAKEYLKPVTLFKNEANKTEVKDPEVISSLNANEEVYTMLLEGFKDFYYKHNFKGIIFGLSGGLDSALIATMARDIIPKENIIAVSMPYKFTSKLSFDIINKLAKNLELNLIEAPINTIFDSFKDSLSLIDNKLDKKVAYNNLQSRIRGQLLMSLSNMYQGYAVINTSNKSELSVGYSTLYGDSCGAFSPLKDVYKSRIFELARLRNNFIPKNSLNPKLNTLPLEVIERAPSAELENDQFDEKELIPYSTLDKILYALIEENKTAEDLTKTFKKEDVAKVIRLLKLSEFKRKQFCPGTKVSKRSFGFDWQYNI